MAAGKRVTKKVKVEPVVTYREEDHVELTLTMDEANFLQDIMGRIGGSPETSRRKHQSPISEALFEAGATGAGGDDKDGSIYFGQTPNKDYIERLQKRIIELGGERIY